MATNKEAASAARAFLNQFRSLVTFAEAVADSGDAEKRIEAYKNDEAAAKKAADDAKGVAAAKQAEIDAAQKRLTDAQSEAQTTVQNAQAQADKILADGRAKFKTELDTAAEQLRAVKEEQSSIEAQIAESKKGWAKDIKALQTDKAAIEKAISELKKQFA